MSHFTKAALLSCVLALTATAGEARTTSKGISDTAFLSRAAMGGMAEVSLSQMALQRSSNPQVQQFAQQMIQDHGMQNQQLMAVAGQVGVQPPTGIAPKHAAIQNRLMGLSGPAFDAEYMAANVQSHRENVALFQRAANGARSATSRQFARQSLPVLQQHLQHARAIDAGLRGGAAPPMAGGGFAPNACVPQPVTCAPGWGY